MGISVSTLDRVLPVKPRISRPVFISEMPKVGHLGSRLGQRTVSDSEGRAPRPRGASLTLAFCGDLSSVSSLFIFSFSGAVFSDLLFHQSQQQKGSHWLASSRILRFPCLSRPVSYFKEGLLNSRLVVFLKCTPVLQRPFPA